MESTIEEIKKKIDIVSFIGSFVALKRAGRNFKGLCPFHQEKTASFVVSPDRQIWHCFGACQEGGDIIKFMMKWENITFIEALRDLAEKAGVKLKRIDLEDKIWEKKERLMNINILAAEYFDYILHKTKFGEKALSYLKNRGLNTKVIKKFQLGYAPASWESLRNFLKKKKYNEQELLDTGLFVKGNRGLYDRFRARIIFPIKDNRGNTIGFSGRTLDDKNKEAKYVNTPETTLYHKRESLFGIDLAKEAIRKEGNIILVEGEFDTMSPYQIGVENIVAIKGSAVTKEQLMLLKRYTNRIIMALDSDAAGEEAMKRGIQEAEDLEFEINIVTFDFAKDPDEAVRTDSIRFKKVIKKPIPFYDFVINLSLKNNPEMDAFSKKRIAEEVIFYIEKIKNPVVQSYYIKKLTEILDVSESSINALIKQFRFKKRQPKVFTAKKQLNEIAREVMLQRYLLSLIFQNQNPYLLSDKIFKVIELNDFSIPAYKKIYQKFTDYRKMKHQFRVDEFIKTLTPELRPVFDEIFLFASALIDENNDKIEKTIYEAKKFSLKRQISDLLSSEKSDEKASKDNIKQINKALTTVEKMIMTL